MHQSAVAGGAFAAGDRHRSARTRWASLTLLLVLAAMGLAWVTAPRARAAEVAVPPTIDRTGTTDATDPLLRFFASVPDGSTINFLPGSRYRIEGTLLFQNRHDLTINGNGATFFATTPGTRNRYHWAFGDSRNILVRDIVVKGANPNAGTGDSAYNGPLEAQHGFVLSGVDGMTLERITVTDVYGDFVYLGRSAGLAHNVIIRDSHFARSGRMGVGITGASDVLIEHNTFDEMRRSVFDFEPNGAGWDAQRVMIRNNTIGNHRLLTIPVTGGETGSFDDVSFVANHLTSKLAIVVVGIDNGRRRRFTVADNVVDATSTKTLPFLSVAGTDGVYVHGNRYQFADPNALPVLSYQSCGVVVGANSLGAPSQHYRNETPDWPCGPSAAANQAAPQTATPTGATGAEPAPAPASTHFESGAPAAPLANAYTAPVPARAEEAAPDAEQSNGGATGGEHRRDKKDKAKLRGGPKAAALAAPAAPPEAQVVPAVQSRPEAIGTNLPTMVAAVALVVAFSLTLTVATYGRRPTAGTRRTA